MNFLIENLANISGSELATLVLTKKKIVYVRLVIAVALIARMLVCDLDVACVADPDSAFMREWGECVTGELNQEEQVWSDHIVRAWTNFAATG